MDEQIVYLELLRNLELLGVTARQADDPETIEALHYPFTKAFNNQDPTKRTTKTPKATVKYSYAYPEAVVDVNSQADLLAHIHKLFRCTVSRNMKNHTGREARRNALTNRVRGPYDSVQEYQRIHMALLHDDYMDSLSEGLQQMLQQRRKKLLTSRGGAVRYESNSVFFVYERKSIEIFNGMLVLFLTAQEAGMIRQQEKEKRFREKKKTQQKQNADRPPIPKAGEKPLEEDQTNSSTSLNSVPFMNGSLLLFTLNLSRFDELMVATVVQQHINDPKRPSKHSEMFKQYEQAQKVSPWRPHIEIDLVRVFGRVSSFLDKPLCLLEPKQYFDPIYHVHRRIGELSVASMPFVSELINANREPIKPKCHITSQLVDDTLKPGFNASQRAAICHALSTRVAMIQGPPGTGKSFVGRELINLLMANSKHRIVVVCNSNQALDQFLGGIVEHTKYGTRKDAVRMGSQTTEPELLNKLLESNARNSEKFGWRIGNAYKSCTESTIDVCTWLKVNSRHDGQLDVHHTNDLLAQQNKKRADVNDVMQAAKFDKLKTRRVFAMTSSFAARNSTFLNMLEAPIVIVEEAAEMLESHVLAALTPHTQHFIQIGDHFQLRPRCCSHLSAAQAQLDVSLFERLHNNRMPAVRLSVQHRAHPQLADLIRGSIYPDLTDADAVRSRPTIRGVPMRLTFVDHRFQERPVGVSTCNDGEAQLIRAFCAYLLQQGYQTSDIAVLCTYRAQLAQLELGDGRGSQTCHGCPLAVVDSFQGREARIVLVSLVRNNRRGKVGFMEAANRACVALSRAKEGAFLFGNLRDLALKSKAWEHVKRVLKAVPYGIGDKGVLTVCCEQHGRQHKINKANDFSALPLGGCGQSCNSQMDCDHRCLLVCHGAATKHKCPIPCRDIVEYCGHVCTIKHCHPGKIHRCGVQCKGRRRECGHACAIVGCHEGFHSCVDNCVDNSKSKSNKRSVRAK